MLPQQCRTHSHGLMAEGHLALEITEWARAYEHRAEVALQDGAAIEQVGLSGHFRIYELAQRLFVGKAVTGIHEDYPFATGTPDSLVHRIVDALVSLAAPPQRNVPAFAGTLYVKNSTCCTIG